MDNVLSWVKKNYLLLLPVILLVVFISSIWDTNYYIGGDIVLPLNPLNNIDKSLFLWEEENRGVTFFKYTLLLWQLPFYILSFLGIPPFVNIKLFIIFIQVAGFVFTYLLYRTLFRDTKYDSRELALVCAFIFILSAASILLLPGVIFLSALPICSYFVIKYLDTGRGFYTIFFAISISLAYFAHLPQAKYLFILAGDLFVFLIIYKLIKKTSLKDILIKLTYLSVITFLLNAFILIPFLFDSFKSTGTYARFSNSFVTYNGDADLHSAALPFISRFFNSNLVNDTSSEGRFLSSEVFTIWTYMLWVIIFIPLFCIKERKEKIIVYSLLSGLVGFIFLAKGSNPPFGEIYKFLLDNIFVFKLFRTTALMVIGGTLFFSMLVSIAIYYLSKRGHVILYLVLFIHIFVFHALYFGYNLITIEQNGKTQKGYAIPSAYYQMGERLDNIKEDVKILSLPIDETYSYKDWEGYSGISIMDWITHKPFIHALVAGYSGFKDNLILQRMDQKESCYWTAINNVGYILNEKDSRIPYTIDNFSFSKMTIFQDLYFKLEKVKSECFLPHVYAATDIFFFQGENNSISNLAHIIKNTKDIVVRLDQSGEKLTDIDTDSNIVIEAYPKEMKNMDKNIFDDISHSPALSSWTYFFTVPVSGNYQMIVGDKIAVNSKTHKLEKGKGSISIPVHRSNSLVNNDMLASNENDTIHGQTLENWEKDTIYLLSLNYTVTKSTGFSILIEETQRTYNGRNPYLDLNNTLFFKEIKQPRVGKHRQQVLLRSDINAEAAKLTLTKTQSGVSIDSLQIEKVTPNKIFFINLRSKKVTTPSITSYRINPTKQIIHVTNAKNPYPLVFSETFDNGWKAYVDTCKESCGIFHEWFLTPIPENRHFIANGFSNMWMILPSDSKEEKSYKIIIEYWPQRLFYIGVIIALVTLIMIVLNDLFRRSARGNKIK